MDKVIVVVGPTGVGKSAVGLKIAETLNSEIISGDSIQIYRQLDIGSAKISTDEMNGIKHYLIDEKDLNQSYNVMEFQNAARKIITDIHARGKIPLIVGGTGLYIKAVLYDYEFQYEDSNMSFMKEHEKYSNEELYSMLVDADIESTKKIHKNNRKRVLRALFMASVGEKKSEIINKQKAQPIYDVFIVGCTLERHKLYERINQRVDLMIKNGLMKEIEGLSKIENIWNYQGMQGIGYREWKEYFLEEKSEGQVVEDIKKHSRQFAKRQYTWFNNQMDMRWYDMENKVVVNDIIEDIEKWRNSNVE